MKEKSYYTAYEKRYRTVYDAGVERWGHSPDDAELYTTLKAWVDGNDLAGKRVIEFACGEGAAGLILSRLGCLYHGVDISPAAIEKARLLLRDCPGATAEQLDMVKEQAGGEYDAALDCMGFHMLVTDYDRSAYLRNARASLKSGASMLFYKEAYRDDAHKDEIVKAAVPTYEEWLKLTGDDYETPMVRLVETKDGDREIMLPLVPARANDREGYIAEMEAAGFSVERLVEMPESKSIRYAASIYVRKL